MVEVVEVVPTMIVAMVVAAAMAAMSMETTMVEIETETVIWW